MDLYILRHGIAEPHCKNDAERPLTKEGKEQIKRLKKLKLSFDLVLSSPLVRAMQTAEALGVDYKITENLIPSASYQKIIPEAKGERVLLVGHEPFLSGFISLLISGGPDCDINLKRGELCKLSLDVLHCGKCATLEWILMPDQVN